MYLFEAMLSQYANATLKNLLSGAENVTWLLVHLLALFLPVKCARAQRSLAEKHVPKSGTFAGMS